MHVEVRGIGSPGAVITGNCEPPPGMLGTPLKERYSLLTLESSLHSQFGCY